MIVVDPSASYTCGVVADPAVGDRGCAVQEAANATTIRCLISADGAVDYLRR